jgi:hypothetical protein
MTAAYLCKLVYFYMFLCIFSYHSTVVNIETAYGEIS